MLGPCLGPTDNLLVVLRRQLEPPLRANRELGLSLPVPPRSTTIPDLVILDAARVRPEANEQPPAIVHVVVEIASPATYRKDRTVKSDKCAQAGIPGYWRVELDPIRVIAYALREDTYAELGAWTAGETVEVDEPVRVRFDPGALLP
ncbi:Uma2 family endonuclease [Nocardioides nitrophenolicus]|uniref:Uma2 family endonuclease n=1 Tax=Nocardioides nitrophenolicus TaxID=60489 RepID=UPI00195AE7E0|nr:Uma2 family endonuclease [Nocardioides nitrophenolicus]MBM7516765.1 Uma2 family endonuclease [Nocardioides nitrophenolicus]